MLRLQSSGTRILLEKARHFLAHEKKNRKETRRKSVCDSSVGTRGSFLGIQRHNSTNRQKEKIEKNENNEEFPVWKARLSFLLLSPCYAGAEWWQRETMVKKKKKRTGVSLCLWAQNNNRHNSFPVALCFLFFFFFCLALVKWVDLLSKGDSDRARKE